MAKVPPSTRSQSRSAAGNGCGPLPEVTRHARAGEMPRVRQSPLAAQDLEDIWFFDPAAADRPLDTFNEKIGLLADNPCMRSARPDIAKDLYHPVGN